MVKIQYVGAYPIKLLADGTAPMLVKGQDIISVSKKAFDELILRDDFKALQDEAVEVKKTKKQMEVKQ